MPTITKRLSRPLAVLLCLCLPLVANAGWLEPISKPDLPPELQFTDLQEQAHDLTEYLGKVVLVNFWASWCSPCLKEMPSMQRLQSQLADKPFQLLAVNAGESAHKAKTSSQSYGPELFVLLDPKLKAFNAWGAKVFPTSYLLDTQGRIRFLIQGPMEWDDGSVLSAIEGLLLENQPSDP
jgi:thiol-disulfide isomerase/thioredoxin